MFSAYKLSLHNQSLWLSHERCIYWENKNALILSDLHFGKSGHFRKSGIAVPQDIFKEDLHRLYSQIQIFNCELIIVVGDLFHSYANKEMDLFLEWRKDTPSLKIQLVKGNHDILKSSFYEQANVQISPNAFTIKPFCFIHDIAKSCNAAVKSESYTFTGHIHPGIRVNGIGKQSLKLPCFHFSQHFAVLPAFSKFTGLSNFTRKPGDQVFALVENKIIEM